LNVYLVIFGLLGQWFYYWHWRVEGDAVFGWLFLAFALVPQLPLSGMACGFCWVHI